MRHKNTPFASEVRCFTRTSVSIDEAVAMLLGWISGPVELRSNSDDPSEEKKAEIDAYYFDLDERIRDIREGLEAGLSCVEYEGPQTEVERLRNELTRFSTTEAKAFAYRCAIEDELNKGVASTLHKDLSLSNQIGTYITLASFDQWAMGHYGLSYLAVPDQSPRAASPLDGTTTPKPRTRFRDQEKAILACISTLGYDPKQLPKNRPGMPGVKKQVRDKFAGNPLFNGTTVFDNAWERLQNYDDLAYA